jgi:hypothetical protein
MLRSDVLRLKPTRGRVAVLETVLALALVSEPVVVLVVESVLVVSGRYKGGLGRQDGAASALSLSFQRESLVVKVFVFVVLGGDTFRIIMLPRSEYDDL